jgi:plasmid maintenance system killer protein
MAATGSENGNEQYRIRMNDQRRIRFLWAQGNVRDVEITDYH